MDAYVVGFGEVDASRVDLVGGKGAHLAALSRIGGLRVPPGFCVTTSAFRRILTEIPSVEARVEALARLDPDDAEAVRAASAELRESVERARVPDDVAAAVVDAVQRLGPDEAFAVRSSATSEDRATTSFAGLHDTYLNVAGVTAVVEHVLRCMASAFTERAVSYRLRQGAAGFADARMAVVVQRMVAPRASGVLFTAHPLTSNRKVAAVEAVPGLGEALVSGRVSPDVFEARDGEVVARSVTGDVPVITSAEVADLVGLGRRIEAHFGCPQDIEWCLAGDGFHFVQARPITTLFPIPAGGDGERHVYISVGHQQMMTDPLKPLGLSLFQRTAGRPMYEAGGRLFVDVTRELASPTRRAGFLAMLGRSDPLLRDALQTVLDRGFVPPIEDEAPMAVPPGGPPAPIEPDPALVTQLIERSRASIEALEREIGTRSGPELVDFVLDDVQGMRRLLFDPQSHGVIMAAMGAAWWLGDQLQAWLGDKDAADVLTQSVPDNVTSEMGLALLDVADVIRPHAEVVEFLRRVDDDGFLDELPGLPGGREARDAIEAWLDAYGMRCVGEIDVTRPRWRERPSALVPLILGHVEHFEPGEGARRFERGLQEARAKEQEVLERLRALPNGEQAAAEAKRRIDLLRTVIGYREYPKYAMIRRYFVYKQALLAEADRLVQAGVLHDREDIFWLTLDELCDVVRTRRVDADLLRQRREAHAAHAALTAPRVITSDGEIVAGDYRRDDLPVGALAGLAVSAGVVEGRARVVLDLAGADLEPGDILVTSFTDPSWTPVFVTIGGLVTEVGGLMTHGAVIAREYGLPAVVGVVGATRHIRDGDRIRVHGTEGYVEILS